MSVDQEWIDDDEEEEFEDNFTSGVDVTEKSLDVDEDKVMNAITVCRKIVHTIKKSSILSSFIEKKRTIFNHRTRRTRKIKRKLSSDVRTRWNSTYLMLNTVKLYRDILSDMFKSKTTIHLTSAQRKKVTRLELTSDMWDILSSILDVLRPFYSATKVLSGTRYPTMGATLYIVRTLEQYLETQESDQLLNNLKMKILKSFRDYIFHDQDQWNALKVRHSIHQFHLKHYEFVSASFVLRSNGIRINDSHGASCC